MKKKLLSVIIFAFAICFVGSVKADSTYFITDNGIELTEFQYNTLVDMLSIERVRSINENDYNNLHVDRMIESEYSYVTKEVEMPEESYPGGIIPYVYHETLSKKLTLTKLCSSTTCSLATTLYWKKKPSVNSYDVIGLRFDNTSFYSSVHAFSMTNTDGTTYYNADKDIRATNGAASIKKISSNVDYFTFDVLLNYTSNGIVFASYQHATSNVTLAQASNFQFKGTGVSGVFLWPTNIIAKYDQMAGVNLTLK